MEMNLANPIGIGTYQLDLENKEDTLKSLLHSYERGQNYISTSLAYANYEVVDFLKEFFTQIERDTMFVLSHLEKYIEIKEDVEKQVDNYLTRMGLDYIDAVQVHASYVSKIPLLDVYEQINGLIQKGKVRYASVSNSSLEELEEITKHFPIYSFEGVYNLENKVYENIGLLDFCKEKDIRFTCYQALRRNKISGKNYPFLTEMAEKYQVSQNQILLNWLVYGKNIYPLVKTNTIENINANLDALSFKLEEKDIALLDAFQHEKFNSLTIDWANTGNGVTIDKLASQLY